MPQDARHQIESAMAELRACRVALDRASAALQKARSTPVQTGFQAPVQALPPATAHRRAHRPGRPPRIDTDPDLRAFILARIDRQTFEAIAADVADHFPPARRVGKSAIHAWWKRQPR